MVEVRNFQKLDIQDKDVVEYLRRGKGSKRSKPKLLSEEYQHLIGIMKAKAQLMLEPKGLFELFDIEEVPVRDCFLEANKVALAIVTIGDKLPIETSKLMKEGKLVDGVILDAIGSAAAETVANLINDEINNVVSELKLQYSERYSPGYCQWDVKDQQIIFDRLPAEIIGVSLTTAFLMNPIKSISFAVNIGKEILASRWENRCKFCEIGDCSYKRE